MQRPKIGVGLRQNRRLPVPFWLATGGGIALTLIAFAVVLHLERHYQQEKFGKNAADVIASVQRILEKNFQSLESVVAFYQSSEQVERQEFQEYVQVHLKNNSAIRAIEWIPYVPSKQREVYERAAKQDGFPDFQFTERNSQDQLVRASQRSEYFPVYFIEPLPGNEGVLGFDLGSNPARLQALQESRDQGKAIATEPITLVQTNKKGFLLFLPIYEQNQIVDSVSSRRQHLKGFALSVFRIEDLINNALELAQESDYELYIFDRSAPPSEQFLYTSLSLNNHTGTLQSPQDKILRQGLFYSDTLNVATQEWLLIAKPKSSSIPLERLGYSWIILLGGGLLNLGFIVYGKNQQNIQRQLQEGKDNLATTIAQQTKVLRLANQQLELEVAERKQKEETIQEVTQRLKLATDAAQLGVWDLDLVKNQLTWDERMYQFYGVSPSEFGGAYEAWQQGLHPEDMPRAHAEAQDAIAGKQGFHTDFRVVWPDGQIRVIEAHGIVVRDESGAPLRMIGMNWDITDRREIERALIRSHENLEAKVQERTQLLEQRAQELQISNRELEQFAYVASHDLKAPLRGIANISAWLQDDISDLIPEESLHHLHLLESRVSRMEAMINGLLQYSRVGRKNIETEAVDIHSLLREVVDELSPPEAFEIILPAPVSIIKTHRVLLKQVLTNLLSNAFKHVDRSDGLIEVRIEDQGDRLRFEVKDNGPGIEPLYHDKIFQIFQTLQRRDQFESTGIGLSIVKKIVEGQKGTISVSSSLGTGSTFTFSWPKEPIHGALKIR